MAEVTGVDLEERAVMNAAIAAAAKRVAEAIRADQPDAADGTPEVFASQMLDEPADLDFAIRLRTRVGNVGKNMPVLTALKDLQSLINAEDPS